MMLLGYYGKGSEFILLITRKMKCDWHLFARLLKRDRLLSFYGNVVECGRNWLTYKNARSLIQVPSVFMNWYWGIAINCFYIIFGVDLVTCELMKISSSKISVINANWVGVNASFYDGWSLTESPRCCAFHSSRGFSLIIIVLGWNHFFFCLVYLCRARCRHLLVPQNSRQPWDLKWSKSMGT